MVFIRLKYTLIVFTLLLISCEGQLYYKERGEKPSLANIVNHELRSIAEQPSIISCTELQSILNSSRSSKILDVRKPEDFKTGHIPGALQIWRNDFNEQKDGLNSFKASKEKIEILFSEMGIRNEDSLILYDDRGAVNAARLWFILSHYGFDKIRFLNGGIHQWKSLNYPLQYLNSKYPKSKFNFTVKRKAKLDIELDELLKIRTDIVLLDSRTIEEFSGSVVKKGAAKGGRIPAAIRFDYSEVNRISDGEDFCFREPWEVEEKLQFLNLEKDSEIVVYCQSGARSALLAFYFREILGMPNVWNYDGSWIEWSHHDELEFEKG